MRACDRLPVDGLLCRRLVRERLYDSACLLLSSRAAGSLGDYREPDRELSFRTFATQLVAHASAFVKLNRYFKRSATLAMPAFAQASSISWLDPELPTPPMVSAPTWIGTPPPSARISATSRCAASVGSVAVRF